MSRIGSLQIAMGLAIVLLYCQRSNATLIVPIGVASSTADSDHFSASKLIGGEGLIGDYDASTPVGDLPVHAVIGADNSWVTADRNGADGDYFAAGDYPRLIFELAEPRALDRIVLWNYAANAGANKNGVRAMTVDFSLTGIEGTFTNSVELTDIAIGFADEYVCEDAQSLSFGGHYLAKYVRLTLTDNFYDGDGGGDRVGLSEVMFLAPEPSSLGLAVIGLVGTAIFLVRRTGKGSAGRKIA